ncbi:4-Cys prefix domain-containing protein [Allocoleopsis franciscana]|uniref:Uncharacterized protein n=1 Tax=Allocoleopsis franciscana PCC 7113 TaxID=1173027 RepID=K9W7T2_9CYAN|nr:4-Cys prefix domain-containing protein [Allocoleopsis franciscana]AFZ16278.1 hypothetical protein Mic7113_0356 [Allocoleopsis franciscana PCC 7113]
MSYCLNPNCLSPQNPDDAKCCQRCQSRLLLKDSPFWSIILANAYQDEKNKWYWALRPQVAEALEELGWV